MSLETIDKEAQFALFEAVINFSDDAIITKTLGGIVTSWNKAAENLFGYTSDEIIGKHISCIIPSDRNSEELEIISKVRAGEYVKHYETERKRKDGSTIYISLTVSPLKDKNGVIVGASKIARDITSQKQMNNSLKQGLKEIADYRYALDESSIVAITNTKGIIQFVNDKFCTISKYSREELIGQDHRMINSGYHPASFIRELWTTIGNGKVWKGEIKNKAKDGSMYWVDTTIIPFLDERSKPYQYVAIRSDITDRKNSELEKSLLSEISQIFNENTQLHESLCGVLQRLMPIGGFSMAEFWLIGSDRREARLTASFAETKEVDAFFDLSKNIKKFRMGEGLPGITWQTGEMQFWSHLDENQHFVRGAAARASGLKAAYGLPLFYNAEVIGILVLGLNTDEKREPTISALYSSIGVHLASEIKRKQLEQELNQVFNFTPDILCIANTDGYFKKVNPAMSVLLGYDEDELLSRPFIEFVHPLDRELTVEELQNVIDGRPTLYIENRYITKSGTVKWLAWTTTSASEHGIFYCSAKDITEKKDLEMLLNKANSLARIGSWEINPEKNTVYWSAITKEIHETAIGFEPSVDEAINFYPEGINRDTIVAKLTEVIDKGVICDVELQILTAKGSTKWIRVIGEAEFANGKCTRVYGSFQDIDARKKAEINSVKALEERNTILESIDDAFFAVDKNWIVTYWNKKAEHVLHKRRVKMLGQNLWEVFSDSLESASYMKYHLAMKTGTAAHFEDYYEPLHKWYEIGAYPSESGLSVYFKDVTHRKVSEIQLNELNENLSKQTKELKISNAELEQFAYVASHDLQEPLRMVTSFLTQLEKKYGDIIDDKGKKYIYFAVDGAKRMRQIILDLLEFSRVGRTDDKIEEVNINKLVADILVLFRKRVEESHAVINCAFLPTLSTYTSPMRQVFQNLISNSLKYQQKGIVPVIDIACEEEGRQWKFSVKDNGIGIDADYFDKIFIIFQRLHNRDEYSGTGMGLAVTKKIVENMGGRIWVESEEGKGSTFYFTVLKLQ